MATSKSYPQQAQDPRHPGFHRCIHHTLLTELFKNEPETLCRRCFKHVGTNNIRLIGMLLVRCEILHRHMKIIEDMFDKLEERFNDTL